MKVHIAGLQGFIARNLITFLNEKDELNLVESTGKNNKFDVVIYIASDNNVEGIKNRLYLDLEVMQGEIDSLADKSDMVFVVCRDNIPDFIANISQINKKIVIFKVPEIFGKWSSTLPENPEKYSIGYYCRCVIQDQKVNNIDDSDLKLLYVDDLLAKIYNDLGSNVSRSETVSVGPVYQIKKRDLITTLKQFKNSRKTLILDGVGSGLKRALYSTYISYLPTNQFSYPIGSHDDSRGSFVEVIKTTENGQVSYFTANPGITRGEHYHHSKTEKFLVIKGTARFQFRHLLSDDVYEINAHSTSPTIVESIPGWVHNITNTGNEELIVLLWANELFDSNNPDTIANEI